MENQSQVDNTQARSRAWRLRLVPWVVGAIQLLAALGQWLNYIPMNKLFQRSLCHAYYLNHDPDVIDGDGNVPEGACYNADIQADVYKYLGLVSTLELVCGKTDFTI